MEVGAVKQAFNNEIILMKKKLNQAKTQVIHKLTRKAKTLTDKKVPEKLKEKLNRKAESAVKEVLILKKINARDLARFMITHSEEAKSYLNKPVVDYNKACARLSLHKVMEDKYKFIRGRFCNVPIKDLFMSRQERIKLKKEEKEKQKDKKKKKAAKKHNNTDSDWKIEDITIKDDSSNISDIDDDVSLSKGYNNNLDTRHHVEESKVSDNEADISEDELVKEKQSDIYSGNEQNDDETMSDSDIQPVIMPIKANISANILKDDMKNEDTIKSKNIIKFKTLEQKHKSVKKNKIFKDKMEQKKFKKDSNDDAPVETKVADPFFITSTGEKYMSVAEPRQPDEVKEIHKQGNRKLRRAVMFGHVPKTKPRQDHNEKPNQNGYQTSNFKSKSSNEKGFSDKRSNFNNKTNAVVTSSLGSEQPDKLHPSWEAKKRQSGIKPFEGKKIVFDES